MKSHTFHPEAGEEYSRAIEAYATIAPELGHQFYDEIERIIAEIRRQPERFFRIRPPARAARTLLPFSLRRGLSRSARPYLDRGRDAWQTASGLLARTPPIAALNPNTKISLQKATKETKQEALNRCRQKKFPCGMSMRLLLCSLRLLL